MLLNTKKIQKIVIILIIINQFCIYCLVLKHYAIVKYEFHYITII